MEKIREPAVPGRLWDVEHFTRRCLLLANQYRSFSLVYVKFLCDLKSRFYFCFTGGNYELMKPVVPSTVPYPDMRSR